MILKSNIWMSFRKLREAVENTRQGMGGLAALNGFSYQFLVGLERIVRKSATIESPEVLLEAISDISILDGESIEVSQVKLTLSASSFGRGIADLWRVDVLARTETPEIVPMLRYKLLCRRSEVADADGKLGVWSPTGEFDEAALTEFRARLAIECHADPRTDLAEALVNIYGVADPFELIDEWLGKLFGASSVGDLAARQKEIRLRVRALEAQRRAIDASFRIWSSRDRPPKQVERETEEARWVLTGQTPNRRDLREGRFAPRSVYWEITEQCEAWLNSRVHSQRELIDAFWISGRSGTGKSVALLHVLSALHAEDPNRVIIWLGNEAGRIGSAVRRSRPFIANGLQVIIAVDDPFTATRQASMSAALAAAKDEMEAITELYPRAPHPVLLMCGPTEQAEAFEAEFADSVHTLLYAFPHETGRDIEELRQWYLQRTGRTSLPVRETEDVLIVQLFFEWATGEKIDSFARRFRDRLKDLAPIEARGPFEVVADILALNRLYALYPAEALQRELDEAPALERAFRQLEEADRHLSFVPDLDGYRLTHPHLADAIYRTWFGHERDSGFRRSQLHRGIVAALDFGDGASQRLAPLWAIWRLISPNAIRIADVADRVALVRDDLVRLLPQIYAERFSTASDPLVDLPVWINLNVAFELKLSPSPFDVVVNAIPHASIDAPGLRLACHILIAQGSSNRCGADAVLDILQTRPEWREWPKVALSYIKRFGLAELAPQLTEFARHRPVQARDLVKAILHLDLADFEERGREIVGAWFQTGGGYLEFQVGFLTNFMDRWGVDEDTISIVLDLLARYPEHPSWSHVFERVEPTSTKSAAQLSRLGHQWLNERDTGQLGWDRVWEQLWRRDPGHSELRELAFGWLGKEQGSRSWGYIWKPLQEFQPDDPKLREIVLEWLRAQPEHQSWPNVWRSLWANDPNNQQLRNGALDWLKSQSVHRGWHLVWKRLWEFGENHEQLRTLATSWLCEQSQLEKWEEIWTVLWEQSPTDPQLTALAEARLSDCSDDADSWARTWRLLWNASPGDDNLRRAALNWIDHAPGEIKEWPKVWLPINQLNPFDQIVRRSGFNRLIKTSWDHKRWSHIWKVLWVVDQTDLPLVTVGMAWLREISRPYYYWPSLWTELWERFERGNDLTSLGLAWLESPSPRPKSWPYVWLPLAKSGLVDLDVLAPIARRLLASTPPVQSAEIVDWLDKQVSVKVRGPR